MTSLPAGGCDCHTHVIGDPLRYPMVGDRHYTPGPAGAAELAAHLQGLGLQRVVVVQPSVYGTDNRCLLESLAFFQGRARGVAVVAPAITDAELAGLHAAGVRGLRINIESSGGNDPAALVASLRRWAGRIGALGWHLQVFAGLETLAAVATELPGLGVPVVLDHFAMTPTATPPNDPRLQRLLQLLATGTAYLKLSAAYRIGGDPAGALRLARLFMEAAPARVLWGSDWPHTDRDPARRATDVSAYRKIAPALLAGQLQSWAPDPAAQAALLVDNPATLYGFD